MKNLLCEKFIMELMEEYKDDMHPDLKINNRIVLEVAAKILDGSFNQYGEIIFTTIPNTAIKGEYLISNLNEYIISSLLVVKLNSKILILDAAEKDSFFDYLKVNKTMCYIEGSNIWFKHFKKDENLSNRIKDIGLLNLNSLNSEIYSFKKKIVKEYINNIRKTEEYLNLTKSCIGKNLDENLSQELATTANLLKLNNFDYTFKYLQEETFLDISDKLLFNTEKSLSEDIDLTNMYINDKNSLRDLFYQAVSKTDIEEIVKSFLRYEKHLYLVKEHSKYFELLTLVNKFNQKINSISDDIFKLSYTFKSGQLHIDSKKKRTSFSNIKVKRNYIDTIHKYSLTINKLCFVDNYYTADLLSHEYMQPFSITNRAKIIFEVSEETITELTSILDKLRENGFIL